MSVEDLRESATPVRVNIGGGSPRNMGNKTIVLPNSQTQRREEVPVGQLPVQHEVAPKTGVEVKESLAKEILSGPNSMMGKYVARKTEEMQDWVAQKAVEEEISEEQEFLGEEPEESGVLFGTESTSLPENEAAATMISESKTVATEDIDFGDQLSKNSTATVAEEVDEYKEPEFDLEDTSELNTPVMEVVEENEMDEEQVAAINEDDFLKHLQEIATEKLKPISKSLNISSFTIAKKATSNLSQLESQKVKAAKWVLPHQDSIVEMKEYLGSELESLREYSEDASNVSMLSRKYRSVYDHIVSAKPASYEAWLKATPYADIDHYFFAIYIACFKGSNYLPMDCKNPKCKETFLTEDVEILNMVKFKDDESKKKFIKLYQSNQQYTGKGLYVSEVVPLSRKIAVGFKEASIYNVLEITSLDTEFRTKYASIIDFIPYIDNLYLIDEANANLIPIGYKIYPENINKTIKSKIVTFAKVLKSLSVDEFGPIKSYVRTIVQRNDGIDYIYPAVSCPKCGKETTEVVTTAEELVFTRYQLGALVNTSLK